MHLISNNTYIVPINSINFISIEGSTLYVHLNRPVDGYTCLKLEYATHDKAKLAFDEYRLQLLVME